MSGLSKLLDEIHRRSLWQVTGIYLAGGWAVFTVCLDLTEALLLPGWVPRYAFVLLLIGLPIILGTSFLQRGFSGGTGEAKGIRRLFTWRNTLTGGVLAFAALGFVAFVRVVLPAPALGLSAGSEQARLAIFPATVRGGADRVLHEGIVDLLRGKLAVIDDLLVVDPGTVIKAVAMRSQDEVVEVARAVEIAEANDWSHFILPVISASDREIRVQAPLFAVEDPGAPLAFAEASGDSDAAFDVIDAVSVELVFAQFGRASARLTRSAYQLTDSDEAWNAFLTGEQAMRRSQHDVALDAFQVAVEEDGQFALAYLRAAVVAALMETDGQFTHLAGSAPTALHRATELAGRLEPREREFLAAFAAFRLGDGDRAESGFRAMLTERPGDVEARFFLAQTLLRLNAVRGRHPIQALPVFTEVLDADPDFTCPI